MVQNSSKSATVVKAGATTGKAGKVGGKTPKATKVKDKSSKKGMQAGKRGEGDGDFIAPSELAAAAEIIATGDHLNLSEDSDSENSVPPPPLVAIAQKKKRISWDRDPRGDANGLKTETLRLWIANNFNQGGKTQNITTLASMLNKGLLKDSGLQVGADSLAKAYNKILEQVRSTLYTNAHGPKEDDSQDIITMSEQIYRSGAAEKTAL
ncbi:hypothetical protein B484DRAFT_436426 [Ochromonadaceae sp. CCMP2298]|nr:hypothetical protein B484DRAFT_436426 [Ochromonadaceae sp. CCMP2298]